MQLLLWYIKHFCHQHRANIMKESHVSLSLEAAGPFTSAQETLLFLRRQCNKCEQLWLIVTDCDAAYVPPHRRKRIRKIIPTKNLQEETKEPQEEQHRRIKRWTFTAALRTLPLTCVRVQVSGTRNQQTSSSLSVNTELCVCPVWVFRDVFCSWAPDEVWKR